MFILDEPEKYSEILRKAIKKYKPLRNGEYFSEDMKKACVVAAIASDYSGMRTSNFNTNLSEIEENKIPASDIPVPFEEFSKGYLKMFNQMAVSKNIPLKTEIPVKSTYAINIVLMTLSDGLEWDYKIADWLEKIGQ